MSEEQKIESSASVPEIVAALKRLRASINATIAEARSVANTHIQRGLGGREVATSITKLQEARMWAGEALGELGHKLPGEYRDEPE